MSKALTLWCPDLLNQDRINEAGEAFSFNHYPFLKKLLAKADKFAVKQNDFFAAASYLFHQPKTLPVAVCQLSAIKQQPILDEFWLKVDPVQMVPDRDTLVMMPQASLGLTEEDSLALMQAFNEHFEQDGVSLEYGASRDWFLHIKQVVDIQSTPLPSVEMKPLNDFFPQGNAAQYWRQLMNECQMLFYSHPVNELRRNEGLPEINSIWAWGEGQVTTNDLYPRPNAVIWSENNYLQGLGVLNQSKTTPPPSDYQAWLNAEYSDQQQHLILIDEIADRIEYFSLEDWLAVLGYLEAHWFEPLWKGLKTGELSDLLLDFGGSNRFHLKPAMQKRFWRFSAKL